MAMPRRAAAGSPPFVLVAALAVVCLLTPAARAADGPSILRIRHHSGPEHTRIVLDLDRACSYEARRVEGPDRVAINLPGARFAGAGEHRVGDGLVERVRRNAGQERAQVVIDLVGRREFRAFSLPPEEGRPDRIVIDILRAEAAPLPPAAPPPAAVADSGAELATDPAAVEVAAGSADGEPPLVPGAAAQVVPLVEPGEQEQPAPVAVAGDSLPAEQAVVAPPEPEAAPLEAPAETRPVVVVIDPGHGGKDPGAIRGSLQEKDIVLDIAREIARQLEKVPGYRVVLTRDRDVFLPLGRRVEIARREKGDVFISIHCNTHPRPAVSGMEVYFLSLQGATDREARELADKENAAGLVGLAPGEDHADLVVDILMDLKKTRVLQDSSRLAATLLTAADRSGVVGGRRVKQAGFQVLKNLAMPSALVEVAYLSNQADYRLLGDQAGRRRLATALVAGIQDWRAGNAPASPRAVALAAAPGGERWETVYRVRSGDSLWKLADRYGTTMNEIARRNKLSERQRELRIGQRLRLPGAGARP